jgi:hypothetical protein
MAPSSSSEVVKNFEMCIVPPPSSSSEQFRELLTTNLVECLEYFKLQEVMSTINSWIPPPISEQPLRNHGNSEDAPEKRNKNNCVFH